MTIAPRGRTRILLAALLVIAAALVLNAATSARCVDGDTGRNRCATPSPAPATAPAHPVNHLGAP